MSNSDGSVVIATSIDESEYEKGLKRLESAIRDLNDSVNQSSVRALDAMRQAVAGLGTGLARELADVRSILSGMEATSQTTARLMATHYAAISDGMRRVSDGSRGFFRDVEASTGIMRHFGDVVAEAVNPLEEVSEAMRRNSNSLRMSVATMGEMDEGLGKTTDITEQCAEGMEKLGEESKKAGEEIVSMGEETMSVLERVAIAMGLGLGVKEITSMVSSMTDLESRARLAAKGTMEVSAVMERLRQIADRAYSPLEATATAFMNNATALNDIGVSIKDQLDLTEALTNALIVSGAKGEQFEMVMNAVNRSLATGKMVNQELEMVMKYGGTAAEGMAASLGTTIQGLKEMAREGRLTSKVLFESLVGNLENWKTAADSMPATINDALVRLRNQVVSTLVELNNQTGFSDAIVRGIDAIKDSMGTLVDVLPMVATGLTAFVIARTSLGKAAGAGLTAFAGTARAIVAETAAMRGQVGTATAFRQALVGMNTAIAGQLKLRDALRIRITGDTAAMAAHTKQAVQNAQATLSQAQAQAQLARAAMTAAATNLQNNTIASRDAALKERLRQTSAAYAAAMNAERVASLELAQAQSANAVAMERSSVARTKEMIAANQSAIALARSRLVVLEEASARHASSNSVYVQTVLRHRIDAQRAQVQRDLNRLTGQQVVLENQLAAALSRASVAQAVFNKALAAGRGLLTMLGGPWGIAMVAATMAVTKLMTAESEGERMTRLYGESVKDLSKDLGLLKESADGAAEGVAKLTVTRMQDNLQEAEKDLEKSIARVNKILIGMPVEVGQVQFTLYKEHMHLLGQNMERDWAEIEELIAKQDESAVSKLFDFSAKYEKMLTDFEKSGDHIQKQVVKNIRFIITSLVDGVEEEQEGLLLQLLGVARKIKSITGEIKDEQSDVSGTGAIFDEAMEKAKTDSTKVLEVLEQLEAVGIRFSGIDYKNAVDKIKSMNDATKSFIKDIDQLTNSVKDRRDALEKALDAGASTWDGSQIEAAKAQIKDFDDQLQMMARDKALALAEMEAKVYAELAVLNEERLRGEKLSEQESLNIYVAMLEERLNAYQVVMQAEIDAEYEKNRKTLENQKETIAAMIQNYASLAAAGQMAAQSALRVANLKMMAEADLAETEAKLAEVDKKHAEDSKKLQTQFDEVKKRLADGIGGVGGANKGVKSDTVKEAEDVDRALREVELTLARLEGRTLKVVELEQQEELIRFTELLEKAGIKGAEAAAKVEEFKAAQAVSVATDNLQAHLGYYEKLIGVLPEATAKVAELRAEMLRLEADKMRASGMPENAVNAYVDVENLQNATDGFSGLRRSVIDFTNELTDDKIVYSATNDILNGMSDALIDGIMNADNFGDAMRNLGNVVVQALMKMMIQMLIIKPIMESLSGLLGGLGGGFGGILGSLFGFGHTGGIVGELPGPKKAGSPLAFLGARRYHSGGFAGLKANEIPIIAQKGEMILTRADQRALLSFLRNGGGGSGGGNQVNVQVVNQTSVPVDARTTASPNQNGGMDVQVFLKEVDNGLAQRQAKGESAFTRSLQERFSLNDAKPLYRGGN